MKASEIISTLEKKIEIERKSITMHNIRLDMLIDVLHMAKKNGYIEKKELVPNEDL